MSLRDTLIVIGGGIFGGLLLMTFFKTLLAAGRANSRQKTGLELELEAEAECPITTIYEVAISKIDGVYMYYPKVNGMYMHIMPEGNVILHKDYHYASIGAKVAWREEDAIAILTKYKNGGYKENIKRIDL